MNRLMKVIISGGGTGGHVFPAIAIANAIRKRHPDAEILFVGAENRMEMVRVPEAGYDIIGLPVAGFSRSNLLNNIKVIGKLLRSMRKAGQIIRSFKPDIAIGVGGYASGPILKEASRKGVPTLIQEQNSYAGVTNKLLSKKASKICVAYEGMETFFPKEKIVLTGNPIRQDLFSDVAREDAYRFFKLNPSKKTILILGGSLGALTINRSVIQNIDLLIGSGVQILWQCGKRYHSDLVLQLADKKGAENIVLYDFISDMASAYAIAHLVISRAGASSISELCALGKPSILIPSPNVAEDHQTKNAMALVNKKAAIMVKDANASASLMTIALDVVKDNYTLGELSMNAKKMALPDAANKIVDEIEKLLAKN